MKHLAIFLATLILCPMFLPMAEAEITSTENVVKQFERNITATDTIPWDDIVNLGDRANATLNSDTWSNFLEDHPGNWVGAATRESLISAPGSNFGNFTVAGATQFSPQELMGGASEGWVRSPIATTPNSELGLQVWHVENPSLAEFVPGEVTTELGVNQTWTTRSNFANDPIQNSLEIGDSSTDFAASYISSNYVFEDPLDPYTFYDGNIDGWDADYGGDGAIGQGSKYNARSDEDVLVRLTMGECSPISYGPSGVILDTEGLVDVYIQQNNPTCSDEGFIGKSYDFDGSNDYAHWNDYADPGYSDLRDKEVDAVSIGVWVKPDNCSPCISHIFTSGDSGVDFGIMADGYWPPNPSKDRLRILHEGFTPSSTYVEIDWQNNPSKTTDWTHIGVTWSEDDVEISSVKVYIDGILAKTQPVFENGNQWDLRNSIIARDMTSSGCSGSSCRYWDGNIDELYIIERELNATEMFDLAFNTYSEEEQQFVSSYGSIDGVEDTATTVASLISLYSTYSLPGSEDNPGGSFIPYPYNENLEHYYTFSEGSGSTTKDLIGDFDLNMYSGGTIYQDEVPQWVDGRHGTGLDFRNDLTDSGANDRRPFKSDPDISLAGANEITAAAWIYHDPDELPIVEDTFFTYGAPFTNNDYWDNLEGGWYIGADGGNYVFGIVTQESSNYAETQCLWDPTSNLTAIQLVSNGNAEGYWLHLALTFKDSVISGYANGHLVVECPTTYAYLNDPNWASSYNSDVISVGAKLQGNEEGDIIIDDFAIWKRAFTSLEMRDFFDNFTALDKYTANINSIQIYGSNTTDEDDKILLKTLYQGIDYTLNPDPGQQEIAVTFNTIYYPYFFWGANISSNSGNHTAVIHSFTLTFESFRMPYDLAPSPLSKPKLIWERDYHGSTVDSDHEYYLDPSGTYGRSYLKFRCPIWPDQDLNDDSTPDSGYLWVFRMDGNHAVNESFEIFISNAFRGLDHYNTYVSLFDPDIGWFNDTLPASLGMDWVFTEGMNAGIRGYELEYKDNPAIEFWYDHGSEITYDSYTRTDVSEIGPYTTITIDQDGGDWDINNERWYADNTDSNQPDWNDHYFTFDDDAIYFANNIDHDGPGAGDKITTCIHLDVNPGSGMGSSETHYNINWNVGFIGNFVKYDHIVCWGKINGMPSGEVGIKWGDCQTGICSWYDNRQFIGGWDVTVDFDNAGSFSEIRIPRDIDGDGEDDISHDLAWTLAVLQTAGGVTVYDNIPNSNPGGTISFQAVMYCWETSPNVDDVTEWCQKSSGLFQGHNYPNYPAPEVTFMLPYQSTEPTNPYVYAVTYDEDLNYIGDTKCRSGDNNVDYIICSGDQSYTSTFPIETVIDHSWDDPRVFLGARFIQFFVEFNTDDVDIKIWAIDKNSEYDQYKPELFNTFYEMDPDRVEDYIEDNTESVNVNDRSIEYGFSPVFDLVVSDVLYCLITITNPCQIPSLEEVNPLPYDPITIETQTIQPKYNHQSTYIHVYGSSSDYAILLQTVKLCKDYFDDRFNPYTAYPGAASTKDLVNCARSTVQSTNVVINYFAQEYINPVIQEASDITSQLTGQIENKHLIWLAAGYLFPPLAISMWVLEYAVGFSIIDFVSFIVPVIQDTVAKLGELAAELFLFIIFLITCGIIVGSTTLINNALHGEWELINQKTSQSLQGAAGWLASVPYVGGSLQAIGSRAIGGLRK